MGIVQLAVLAGLSVVAAIATAIVAIFLRRRMKRPSAAATLAGLVVPLLLCALALPAMFDAGSDVDGPPPGMVALGVLTLAAVLAPITLIVSGLVTRWACIREARQG